MSMTAKELKRFWKHVSVAGPDECWLWTAHVNKGGYGVFWVGSLATDRIAHRLSWQMKNGEIPDGKVICHKCDVPACVNPDHLFVGTHRDNVEDKIKKGRCPKGESHCCAKLKERDVFGIRKLIAAGMPQFEIGPLFGVTPSLISAIKTRRKWKHV